MEFKFNWDKILKEKTVVHLDTEEKYIEVSKENDRRLGRKDSDYMYNIYKKYTCENFFKGMYADVDFYKEKGYTILTYDDILDKPTFFIITGEYYQSKESKNVVNVLNISTSNNVNITYSYYKDKSGNTFTITSNEFYDRFDEFKMYQDISAYVSDYNVPTLTLRLSKRYKLDIDSINKSIDYNTKMNLILNILDKLQLTFDDSVEFSEEEKQFIKEV